MGTTGHSEKAEEQDHFFCGQFFLTHQHHIGGLESAMVVFIPRELKKAEVGTHYHPSELLYLTSTTHLKQSHCFQ